MTLTTEKVGERERGREKKGEREREEGRGREREREKKSPYTRVVPLMRMKTMLTRVFLAAHVIGLTAVEAGRRVEGCLAAALIKNKVEIFPIT